MCIRDSCRSLSRDRRSIAFICKNSVVSIELTCHFFSRTICGKIRSCVNLSISLLHEPENYIGRRLRDRRTIDGLHFRNSMVSIELTICYLICSGFAVFFFGGELSWNWRGIVQVLGWGELSGAICPRGELSGYHLKTLPYIGPVRHGSWQAQADLKHQRGHKK